MFDNDEVLNPLLVQSVAFGGYSGVPHIRFSFLGARAPLDLRFRGPLEAKSFVRGSKSTYLGPREGSLILNVDLVVMTAAVSDR